MSRVLLLQPPSPPGLEVTRDYAGGFGVAVNVNRDNYGHGPYSIPYSFLMYSAGILKRDHDIIYIDAQAERYNAEETIKGIQRSEPDVIVAVLNLPSLHYDLGLLQMVRKRIENPFIIAIGSVCKVIPEEISAKKVVDVVIHGEPESVLPKLIGNHYQEENIRKISGLGFMQNGQYLSSGVDQNLLDISRLPWPPFDVMPINRYRDPHFGPQVKFFPVWASRGCPMPCSFYCPYPIGMGRRVRTRSSEDFVSEIFTLNKDYGVRGFTFRDQLFSSNIERAMEICELLINKNIDILWFCETRFDLVTEKLLKKMKKAGCKRIHFGLETGDPELLFRVGKPGLKISTVQRVIRLVKDVGIQPSTHIILGLPGENQTTIHSTFKTLRRLGNIDISINLATPYPGTKLYQYAIEKNLIMTNDWSKYTSFSGVMRTESMTLSELEQARKFLLDNYKGTKANFERFIYFLRNRMLIDAVTKRFSDYIN